ncbi:type IV pilin protein [Gilvimarinus sp. F26214L]|uniref:type IV pilin protein n=1 Tax=Gilvimarinus sp. DZF01 TaxID=3461371 RepID=UPI0040454955
MMFPRKAGGFTLIEVMITCVIVAILAAFAYPMYQDSVAKSRRSDGIGMLNQVMQAQERYFTREMTYTDKLKGLGYNNDSAEPSAEGYYKVTAGACAAGVALSECVLVTAVPQGQQAGDGNLTLNSRGVKTGPW